MSQYGPCEKCGVYTSVGPYKAIICVRCDESDETYSPENNLDHHVANEDISEDEIAGIKVNHIHLGQGEVVSKFGTEVEVDFRNNLGRDHTSVASDCLEVIQ